MHDLLLKGTIMRTHFVLRGNVIEYGAHVQAEGPQMRAWSLPWHADVEGWQVLQVLVHSRG